MMQAFELSGYLLLCHEDDIYTLAISNIVYEDLMKSNFVHVFRLRSDKKSIEEAFAVGDSANVRRYLDRFYLYTPDDDPEKRQQIVDTFFDLISEEYDTLIDVERNRRNIRNLIEFLTEHVRADELLMVIDYGCGTGLSVGVTPTQGPKIVGVDRCPKMRQIASLRGLKVWSPDELERQPDNSFAGAFASYVLHLRPHALELELLWARVRPGGMFVANFHKNQGVRAADALMHGLGATHRILEPPADSRIHGAYVAYLKG